MRQLGIIGASGHGKVAADIAIRKGYDNIIFFDDNDQKKTCGDYSVVGKCDEILKYISTCDVFVAIGNVSIRKRILENLINQSAEIVTLVHPDAVIGYGVQIGIGSVVMAGAVLNPECRVGRGCIVNTCASVDHDCCVGDYVHISVGAHVAGTVIIGNDTWIGAGVIVNNDLHITDSCTIGSGAVVIKDIEERGTYIGVPARKLKMEKEERIDYNKMNWGGVILYTWQTKTERIAVLLLLQLAILQLQGGKRQ